MIIWSGIGIIIPLLWLLFYWLTGLFFEEARQGLPLHHAIAFFAAGLFWFLTMKRKEAGEKKIREGTNQKLIDALNKRDENPMFDLQKSSLFFIPAIWWHYIFYAAGLAFLITYFIKSA